MMAAGRYENVLRNVVIYGKSGSGKNYANDMLRFRRVISRTTRQPRPGEVNGKDYHFITEEDMRSYKADNIFNPEIIQGNHYFCLRSDLENTDSYIVGPKGAEYMQKMKENNAGLIKITMVYVKSPVYKRVSRMKKRGDSWKEIGRRLRQEINAFKGVKPDIIISN